MDRPIAYTGQLLPASVLLELARYPQIGLAKLAAALLGTSTQVTGFACVPTGPASMQVVVGPGEIYALDAVDATAYGDLGADNAHQILKQGIALDSTTLAVTAPVTAGQSVNYLVQVQLQEQDAAASVLPHYNSANPAQPFLGPNNTGAAQATRRNCAAVLSLKQGAAAATGAQVTPAPDAGKVGLWVITVANGQATVNAGHIMKYASAPFISPSSAVADWVRDVILGGGQTPDENDNGQLLDVLQAMFSRRQMSAVQNTTSGTAINFTAIPAWAKKVTVSFSLVSTSGADAVQVQLGTAAAYENANYKGTSGYINPGAATVFNIGTGVGIPLTSEPSTRSGQIVFTLVDPATNVWAFWGGIGNDTSADIIHVAGRKALADLLTRLRITTITGADTFDGGQASILIEG